MKADKLYITAFLLAIATSIYGQNNQTQFVNGIDHAILLSCEIELNFPYRFYKRKTNYEEGVFYNYFDREGACITVFQGTLVSFPEDTCTYSKKKHFKNKITYTGYNDGYYWRKDSYKYVRIYYNNVEKRKKHIFDKILNKIKISCFQNEN